MKLYNTLTRSLEDFKPIAPPRVTMYVCGPTVYDVPHIGHARSAYIFDILRRYLAYRKYDVTFIRNVTDVDDKIIEKARQELGARGGGQGAGDLKSKCREVAERYLKSYHDALNQLGIQPPTKEPKATEHVVPDPKNVEATKKIDASMAGFISQLITKNVAYPAGGDVYFSVRKFPNYGKLSNRSLDELQAGARVEPGEHKEDPLDFALWKAAKPDEPSWNSPWGSGRPGWHIECAVMSTAYLEDAFDIHGGGLDLIFPHHENEIAQAQALGKPFAKYWIHNGLLTVNGEKMSKSLGNYITVGKALEECHGDTRILKVFFLGAHYRSPMDYSSVSLRAAASRWNNWYSFLFAAETQRSSAAQLDTLPAELASFKKEFGQHMDDDLNTPASLAVLNGLITLGHSWWKELEAAGDKNQQEIRMLRAKIVGVADVFRELGEILGLEWRPIPQLGAEETELLKKREAARKKKDFAASDKIRKELDQRGWVVEDTPLGQRVAPKR